MSNEKFVQFHTHKVEPGAECANKAPCGPMDQAGGTQAWGRGGKVDAAGLKPATRPPPLLKGGGIEGSIPSALTAFKTINQSRGLMSKKNGKRLTPAQRQAIRNAPKSTPNDALAKQHGVSMGTIERWRKRPAPPLGPASPRAPRPGSEPHMSIDGNDVVIRLPKAKLVAVLLGMLED